MFLPQAPGHPQSAFFPFFQSFGPSASDQFRSAVSRSAKSILSRSFYRVKLNSKYFGGISEDLTAARPYVHCPILRKDFMIDVYQLFEAKAMGADVILLIAAALTVGDTLELARQAKALSLEVLLEIHNKEELVYINDFVDMVGVNNRNLKTFEVSTDVSFELAGLIPDKFVKISESGISSPETVNMLKVSGYQGFLMGENFMKELNPAESLRTFIERLELLK